MSQQTCCLSLIRFKRGGRGEFECDGYIEREVGWTSVVVIKNGDLKFISLELYKWLV